MRVFLTPKSHPTPSQIRGGSAMVISCLHEVLSACSTPTGRMRHGREMQRPNRNEQATSNQSRSCTIAVRKADGDLVEQQVPTES